MSECSALFKPDLKYCANNPVQMCRPAAPAADKGLMSSREVFRSRQVQRGEREGAVKMAAGRARDFSNICVNTRGLYAPTPGCRLVSTGQKNKTTAAVFERAALHLFCMRLFLQGRS